MLHIAQCPIKIHFLVHVQFIICHYKMQSTRGSQPFFKAFFKAKFIEKIKCVKFCAPRTVYSDTQLN